MKLVYPKGTTSRIITVFIQNNSVTTGAGLSGLTNASSITGGYVREGGTGVALAVDEDVTTEGTYQAPSTAAHVRIGTPANMRAGTYELHFHNDLWATGAEGVVITLGGATNMADIAIEVQLSDPVRGLGAPTALPNAAAEAAGGLYTRGSGAGQINQQANGQIDANCERLNNSAIPVTNLSRAYNLAGATLTADSGTTTTLVDAALTQADTDYWKDDWVLFTSGTIQGQCRRIVSFDPATDTITFAPATTQSVGTNTYVILPGALVNVGYVQDTAQTAGDIIGDTNDIQSRLPAALTAGGFMKSTLQNEAHGGVAATLTLERIIVASTTAGEPAMKLTGNTSGAGLLATGGATGSGIVATGVGTGDGLRLTGGTSATAHGLHVAAGVGSGSDGSHFDGDGGGSGLKLSGGAAGYGLWLLGGATGGHALKVQAQFAGGANGIDVQVAGGHGVNIAATGTDKHGILVTGGTGGTSDGVKFVAGTGGLGFRVDTATFSTFTVTTNAIAWNTAWDGEVQSECADALTAYGASTHSAADVWAVATRVLTAGTNIVLAKGVGVTGFNDLSAAQVNAEVVDVVSVDTLVAGKTMTKALQLIGATAAGVISGAGTATETFQDFAGATSVTVTADASGNRTAVVYA